MGLSLVYTSQVGLYLVYLSGGFIPGCTSQGVIPGCTSQGVKGVHNGEKREEERDVHNSDGEREVCTTVTERGRCAQR